MTLSICLQWFLAKQESAQSNAELTALLAVLFAQLCQYLITCKAIILQRNTLTKINLLMVSQVLG